MKPETVCLPTIAEIKYKTFFDFSLKVTFKSNDIEYVFLC
jgi:hypothetical protein